MRNNFLSSATLLCALLLRVASARAGGLEYAGGQGAQALGRGGAVTARADDPMVLAYNPAGLAELRGTQFLFNTNLAWLDACFDPVGYYGWGVYLGGRPSVLRDRESGETRTLHLADAQFSGVEPYYTDKLDTVCLKQNIVPTPQFAWAMRVSERLGIGAGLIFPSTQPSGWWGGRDGIIHGDTGELRPAATRYMLLRAANIGVFPTIGAGYRLLDRLRLGAAVEWGIISVDSQVMSSVGGGTTPKNDIIAHVKAQDWFIPAFTVSAHAVPLDALDVVVAFRFQDDINAKGSVDLTTGVFDPELVSHTTRGVTIEKLHQGFPWKLRAGVRYADRFAPRPRGDGRNEADPSNSEVIHDPLQDEHWDIELDAEYQRNARIDKQVINYTPFQKVEFEWADPDKPISENDAPAVNEIQKHWRNQLSLRLGGTFNVVPGRFGVSAGAHYENRGVDPDYMQVDVWPLARIGVHGGVIVRVAKLVDLVFSYGHIFQETLIVEAPQHQDRGEIASCWAGSATPETQCLAPAGKIGAIDKSVGRMTADRKPPPVLEERKQGKRDGIAKVQQIVTNTAAGQPPYIINAGRYRSNFDMLAIGANLHF